MKEVDTEIAFHYWMKNARQGEWVVYYDGFLMRDREAFMRGGGGSDSFPQSIRTAILAWKSYLNGAVRLIQKKSAPYEYQYIAIKK